MYRCSEPPRSEAIMNKQLAELATYRKELQGLYEQTHAELQASRADAASEKVERDKLSAENALLRRWNAQLSDELSVIMSELRRGDANDDGDGLPAIAEQVAPLAGGALSRANIELLERLLAMRSQGTRREQSVAARLLDRLESSGSDELRREVRRLRGAEADGSGALADAAAARVAARTPMERAVSEQSLQLELAATSVRLSVVRAVRTRPSSARRPATRRCPPGNGPTSLALSPSPSRSGCGTHRKSSRRRRSAARACRTAGRSSSRTANGCFARRRRRRRER